MRIFTLAILMWNAQVLACPPGMALQQCVWFDDQQVMAAQMSSVSDLNNAEAMGAQGLILENQLSQEQEQINQIQMEERYGH